MESSALEQFFQLLLQACKSDTSEPRVAAILKRLLQQCLVAPTHFTAAALLVFDAVLKAHPAIASSLSTAAFSALLHEESDDEEHFRDVPDDDAAEDQDKPSKAKHRKPKVAETPSKKAVVESYDWHKRDPEFARAEQSALWEIVGLTQHFHPFVAQCSRQLLEKGSKAELQYEGKSPVLDFKVVNMLDRMTYKDPKTKMGRSTSRAANVEMPITSYWKQLQGEAEAVAQTAAKPHEAFFVKYFANRDKQGGNKKGRSGSEELDKAADEIIEAEMKKIAGKEGDPDSDLEDEEEGEDEGNGDGENNKAMTEPHVKSKGRKKDDQGDNKEEDPNDSEHKGKEKKAKSKGKVHNKVEEQDDELFSDLEEAVEDEPFSDLEVAEDVDVKRDVPFAAKYKGKSTSSQQRKAGGKFRPEGQSPKRRLKPGRKSQGAQRAQRARKPFLSGRPETQQTKTKTKTKPKQKGKSQGKRSRPEKRQFRQKAEKRKKHNE